MSFDQEALSFGIYLGLVGMGVTFGSLFFLYFILLGFAKYRSALKKRTSPEPSSEPLPPELIALVVAGIENYLMEDREKISPEMQLETRKLSAWKISGRSEE